MNQMSDLTRVRVLDVNLIPCEFIDKIKNKNYSTKEFYEINSQNAYIFCGDDYVLNNGNQVFVFIDEDKKMQGVLWCTLEDDWGCLELFSVSPKYWKKGDALKFAIDTMQEVFPDINQFKVFTNKPGLYEKIGFKRSSQILMELKNG